MISIFNISSENCIDRFNEAITRVQLTDPCMKHEGITAADQRIYRQKRCF